MEIRRDIPEYRGKYQASTEGRIRRVYASGKTRLMKPYPKKMHKKQLFVKLTKDGVAKDEILAQIIAKTFIGPIPQGCVPYHKNGCQMINNLENIEYISKKELGKLTGMHARQQTVAKIDQNGQIVDVYRSAREAARLNYMSYQTVIDRCNNKCQSAFAPDGYAYAWENSKKSIRNALAKIEKENGFMPKAKTVEFDF